MYRYKLFFLSVLLAVFAACNSIESPLPIIVTPTETESPIPTETIADIKRPEPGTPLISGKVTGLPDDKFVIIRAYSQTGHEKWAEMKGSGNWGFVLSNAGESDIYVVEVEADGYNHAPERYNIYIKNKVAYLLDGDNITQVKARQLHFHFYQQIPTPEITEDRTELTYYEVQAGDNLFDIAKKHDISPDSVLFSNPEIHPHAIVPGLVLAIPPEDGFYYTWEDGDELLEVAHRFDASISSILNWPGNELTNVAEDIESGRQIFIPGGSFLLEIPAPPFDVIGASTPTP